MNNWQFTTISNGGTALKKIISLGLACLLLISTVIPAAAAGTLPYDSYTYDFWEDIVITPAPYVPGRSVSGVSLGVGAFARPQDLTTDAEGRVYIADSGNNRIVITNQNMTEAIKVVEEFHNDNGRGFFNGPTGITICSTTGWLYVADMENLRIIAVEVDFNGDNDRAVRTIDRPQDSPLAEMLDEGFIFQPQKVAVDYAGRVYVIARGIFQGIMVFNQEDEFTGFFGTIPVVLSPWQIFWRALETEEQRRRRIQYIPTEFTGIDVDPSGFIYASNIDTNGLQAVRRLNPTGEDVIRKGENQNLGGDLIINPVNEYAGASRIIDVAYRGKGIYSLLDRQRGRIFTYDREGNLLYIFGGLGLTAGTFTEPVSIEIISDNVAVLDAGRNEIITFEVTLYGQLINEAVGLRFDGDEALAVEKWREVLKLNENLEIANVGIGKAYLTAGDNVSAMHYLRLGQSRSFYSVAYRRHRNEVLRNNMSWILSGVMLVVLAIPISYKIRKRKHGDDGSEKGGFVE
jgi:DNA-binding beta-propeller fold protein YncE